jgi:hypothetical protein
MHGVGNIYPLWDGFPVSQRRRDRTAGLGDVILLLRDRLWLDPTIMFVTPYDEIYAVVEHAFRDRVLWTVLDALDGGLTRSVTKRNCLPTRYSAPLTDFDAPTTD